MKSRRRAIARLVEVIIASVMLVASWGVTYYYLVPANPFVQRGTSDLNKTGFDVLNSLAGQGGLDTSILNAAGVQVSGWEQNLLVTLASMMPAGLMFNLTVYQAVSAGGTDLVNLVTLNVNGTGSLVPITNAQPAAFTNAGQVNVVTYIYTTSSFHTMVFSLQLARSGGM